MCLAFSKSALSPPIITVSAPFSAPACPPETGASRKPQPCAFDDLYNFFAISADAVVLSIWIAPFFIVL